MTPASGPAHRDGRGRPRPSPLRAVGLRAAMVAWGVLSITSGTRLRALPGRHRGPERGEHEHLPPRLVGLAHGGTGHRGAIRKRGPCPPHPVAPCRAAELPRRRRVRPRPRDRRHGDAWRGHDGPDRLRRLWRALPGPLSEVAADGEPGRRRAGRRVAHRRRPGRPLPARRGDGRLCSPPGPHGILAAAPGQAAAAAHVPACDLHAAAPPVHVARSARTGTRQAENPDHDESSGRRRRGARTRGRLDAPPEPCPFGPPVHPGNGGTSAIGANLPVGATDLDGVVRAAREHRVDPRVRRTGGTPRPGSRGPARTRRRRMLRDLRSAPPASKPASGTPRT